MIRVLAIDDEPLALQQLATYIQRIPYFELVASCASAAEARTYLEKDVIDAIFIDINMPDLNGLDFVRSLLAPPLGGLHHCLFGIRHRRFPGQCCPLSPQTLLDGRIPSGFGESAPAI